MLRRRHFPFTKAVKFGFSVFFIHSAHTYWIQIFGFSHRVGRIVAIEGSNMLILWSLQTFSLYQNQDEELTRLTQSRLGKNDVPPSASSQNMTFVFWKYLMKNIPHITVNNRHVESPALTVWSELGYYGDGLSCIFQSCGCLLVCCTGQVHPIHLRIQTHTISSWHEQIENTHKCRFCFDRTRIR